MLTRRRWSAIRVGTWCLILAAGLLARRAAGEVLSLEHLERQALTHRGSLAAERARISGARADAALARSARSPTLAVNTDASLAPGSRLFRMVDADGTPILVQGWQPLGEEGAFTPEVRYGSVFTLQSRLHDFGRTRATIDAADARARAAGARLIDERTRVIRSVRDAYVQWLAAVEMRAATERAARVARDGIARVEGQVAEGLQRAADLAPLRHREVEARLDVLAAREQVARARAAMERTIGAALPKGAEPDRSLLERSFAASGVFRPPEALERERAAALAEVRAHEHRHAPVLSAAADAGVRGQRTELLPVYRVALFLSVPLLDGGAESARAAAARAGAAELAAQNQEVGRALLAEHVEAEQALRFSAERIRASRELLGTARQMVRDAEGRFEVGEARVEELIEVRSLLVQAEIRLLRAKISRAEAGLRLTPIEP
jgi:outer membrane protein